MSAAQPIPLHAVAAFLAALLGGVQLWRHKGGTGHRWLGRLWVLLMAMVAGSSFFISEIQVWGRFSPIHLLSVFTLAVLVFAVHAARNGKIDRHQRAMRYLFFLALILTGGFTLLPGRIMHQVLFGG